MSDEGRRELTINDLEEIRVLVECGMQDEAEEKFIALSRLLTPEPSVLVDVKHSDVYAQVGTLTRGLHDAIKSFAEDERLRMIANVDIPKASERLSSIISMTDSAASRTLDAVDECAPMIHDLNDSIDKLLPAWSSLMKGRIDRDNFVSLCRNVDMLIKDTQHQALKLSEQLNVILMAQDYQDLTGQMIQKVIALVSEVEEKLLQFLMHFSDDEQKKLLHGTDAAVDGLVPQGPATGDSLQSEKIAANQEDVDDLLASLGF